MSLKEFDESLDIDIPTMEETFRMVSSGTVSLGRMPGKTKVYKHFNNILIALSKQIPKSVKVETHIEREWSGRLSSGGIIVNETLCKSYHCPTCGKCVGNVYFEYHPKHCEECGQALRYIK